MRVIAYLIILGMIAINGYLLGNEAGFNQGLAEGHADCILDGYNLTHKGEKVK